MVRVYRLPSRSSLRSLALRLDHGAVMSFGGVLRLRACRVGKGESIRLYTREIDVIDFWVRTVTIVTSFETAL